MTSRSITRADDSTDRVQDAAEAPWDADLDELPSDLVWDAERFEQGEQEPSADYVDGWNDGLACARRAQIAGRTREHHAIVAVCVGTAWAGFLAWLGVPAGIIAGVPGFARSGRDHRRGPRVRARGAAALPVDAPAP